jgi:hypothetical protein
MKGIRKWGVWPPMAVARALVNNTSRGPDMARCSRYSGRQGLCGIAAGSFRPNAVPTLHAPEGTVGGAREAQRPVRRCRTPESARR